MMRELYRKIAIAVLFAAGMTLSWGGMFYATNDAYGFRPVGIVAAIIGYGMFLWAICLYEKGSEEQEEMQ